MDLIQGSKGKGRSESDVVTEMGRLRAASNVVAVPERELHPLETFEKLGVPLSTQDPGDARQVREWCRGYYATHNLIPTCIDIYSSFPVQGVEVDCKDQGVKEFFEELFFGQLDYESFLIELGREFFITGEVTTLGTFDDEMGVWTSEEILNPDDLEVTYLPLLKESHVKIRLPEYLRDILRTRTPAYEYSQLVERFPQLVESSDGEFLEPEPGLVSRIVNRLAPWDSYGTPRLLRSFRQLISEEALNSAQDAVASRLYAPFIQARVGLNDGGNGVPWIPTEEDLDNVKTDLIQALEADFRLMVSHMGVELKSVLGRESMPRLDSDYDRIEKKILQTWGIGEALLSGSSNGAYASSALNRDLITQLMSSWQHEVSQHFRRRAEVVCESQGFYDYEVVDGERVPLFEEVVVFDDNDERKVVRKPKLLIPSLKFKTLNLKDEAQERQFLQSLKDNGIPLSDRTLAMGLDIDLEDEQEAVKAETTRKLVADVQARKDAFDILSSDDLPIPEDLSDFQEEDAFGGDFGPSPSSGFEPGGFDSGGFDSEPSDDVVLDDSEEARPEESDEQRSRMPS